MMNTWKVFVLPFGLAAFLGNITRLVNYSVYIPKKNIISTRVGLKKRYFYSHRPSEDPFNVFKNGSEANMKLQLPK